MTIQSQKIPQLFTTKTGTYRIIKPLGKGGSGSQVFKVKFSGNEFFNAGFFALKYLCDVDAESDPMRYKRFKNELRFAAREEYHPNLLQSWDNGSVEIEGKDYPFYVMPIYPTTLDKLIATHKLKQKKMLDYFEQLLDAVEFMNQQGFVHRDLKPENIFYDAENDLLIVADFGITDFSEGDEFDTVETQTGIRLASVRYGAPEQLYAANWRKYLFHQEKNVDKRADIYTLGLIFNEMFTGIHPLSPHGRGFVESKLYEKHKKLYGYEGIFHNQEDLEMALAAKRMSTSSRTNIQQQYGYLDDLFKQMTQRHPDQRLKNFAEVRTFLETKGKAFEED